MASSILKQKKNGVRNTDLCCLLMSVQKSLGIKMKKRAIITIDYNIPNGTIEEIAKKHELLSRFLKVFGEMDEQIVSKSMKLIDVNDDEITNVTQLKFQ